VLDVEMTARRAVFDVVMDTHPAAAAAAAARAV